MLDPRIYRMSLLLPAIALVILAFSLGSAPGGRSAALAPDSLQGANIARDTRALAGLGARRAPGSPVDAAVARLLARRLGTGGGFSVSTRAGRGGATVLATRPGTDTGAGSVLVLAPRDSPGAVGLAGTATLLELGRVLGGETLQRTVTLASVPDMAAVRRLAAAPPASLDGVIVLGDLGSRRVHGPVVLPWSDSTAAAPTALRATVASAFAAQTGLSAGAPTVLSQLAHLAFPLAISGQSPFLDRGVPAVELSVAGVRGAPAGSALAGAGRLGAVGRAVLASVTALDTSAALPAPSTYLVFDRQIVPRWAVALFVLALLLPVLLTTVDGLARALRRRYPLRRALGGVLAAAVPFLAAGVVIVLGGAVGALPAPASAQAAHAVHVSGGAIAVLAIALLVALLAGSLLRPTLVALLAGSAADTPADARRERRARDPRSAPGDGPWAATAAATLLVLCAAAILVWLSDPFAAALLVPALHLWLWALDADLPLGRPVRLLLLAVTALPVAGLVVFHDHALGFGAPGSAWEAVLLLSGHVSSWTAAVEWAFVLGCGLSAVTLVLLRSGATRRLGAPAASVRGPVGYAGPGSLGGTNSALRR